MNASVLGGQRIDEMYEMDWNISNILHSVGERVDCVLLLVLVLLLSKHNYVPLNLNKS